MALVDVEGGGKPRQQQVPWTPEIPPPGLPGITAPAPAPPYYIAKPGMPSQPPPGPAPFRPPPGAQLDRLGHYWNEATQAWHNVNDGSPYVAPAAAPYYIAKPGMPSQPPPVQTQKVLKAPSGGFEIPRSVAPTPDAQMLPGQALIHDPQMGFQALSLPSGQYDAVKRRANENEGPISASSSEVGRAGAQAGIMQGRQIYDPEAGVTWPLGRVMPPADFKLPTVESDITPKSYIDDARLNQVGGTYGEVGQLGRASGRVTPMMTDAGLAQVRDTQWQMHPQEQVSAAAGGPAGGYATRNDYGALAVIARDGILPGARGDGPSSTFAHEMQHIFDAGDATPTRAPMAAAPPPEVVLNVMTAASQSSDPMVAQAARTALAAYPNESWHLLAGFIGNYTALGGDTRNLPPDLAALYAQYWQVR